MVKEVQLASHQAMLVLDRRFWSGFSASIRKRRRGVARAIDFTVAFSLFIIMYTQFLLVLINTNNIVLDSAKESNPAQALATHLLGKTGIGTSGSGWANDILPPTELGLSSNYSARGRYNVDLNKLARLNPDLRGFQASSVLTDQWVDISSRDDLGLPEDYSHIRITTRSALNVTVSTTIVGPNITQVSVTLFSGKLGIDLGGINVVGGVYEFQNLTWSGGSEFIGTIPVGGNTVSIVTTITEPINSYIVVVYAESSPITTPYQEWALWGLGWTSYD
ncbi:MAG TPA: hypothetical protein VJ044_16505, partial [Candidatus Hodarchaeales archaeon]|nr:hypothetical protein [Candidatus Hodarchaeales archaeon]